MKMSLIAYLLTQLECDLSGPKLWRKIRKVTNIIIISAYLWILTLTEFHFKEKFQKSLQVLTVASSVLQCLLCFSGICTKIPFFYAKLKLFHVKFWFLNSVAAVELSMARPLVTAESTHFTWVTWHGLWLSGSVCSVLNL